MLKKRIPPALACALLSLALFLGAATLFPQESARESSPQELYQKAYRLIQEAKASVIKNLSAEAKSKYEEARGVLEGIVAQSPDWNTQAVKARLDECAAALKGAKEGGAQRRPTLLCCGAQGTIFGSNYLLDTGAKRIVIDAGLFSESEMKTKNFSFPFDSRKADACVISHAHTDHIAKLPLLYKKAFKGHTYCSEPTQAMAETIFDIVNMLRDDVAVPYGKDDIEAALKNLRSLELRKWYSLGGGTKIRLLNTGHILGAVMPEIVFTWEGKEYTFLYAVDTRNLYSPLTPPWEHVESADWVLIESVYGNRDHGDFDKEFEKFTNLINDAILSNGTIMVPAYSVDRTQKMIYFFYELWRERKLRRQVDIYVDSKIANRITADHIEYWKYLGEPIQNLFKKGINPFDFPGLHEGAPPKTKKGAKIIIAPSAMCDEGTSIVKHIKEYVGDKNSVVIFTGFVLPESIGGQILARKERVMIDGEEYPVRCKAYRVSVFSGHADRNEITNWFSNFKHVGVVLVVHGLPDGSAGLAHKLHDELGLKTYVPRYLERVDLIELLNSPQKTLPLVAPSDKGE
jgi:metallo-beta-lactamase family protein